jgi:hypothetical protein
MIDLDQAELVIYVDSASTYVVVSCPSFLLVEYMRSYIVHVKA